MVCFQTQNPNLGKFWRTLEWKILLYFTAIWYLIGNLVYFNHVLVCCTTKNLETVKDWPAYLRGRRRMGA
jgi:hypothetical protein